MKAYHICHHNDLDGITAAAVIYEYLKIVNKNKKKDIMYFFYKIDYTMDLRNVLPKNIPSGDEIYFVDYSFSDINNLKHVLELSTKDIKVTWIDHHKTSEDIVKKYTGYSNKDFDLYEYNNFYYLIDTKYCGAYLAYLYADQRLNGCYVPTHKILVPTLIELDNMPLFIKYVDSWDTWKHNMPYTEEFNLGMSTIKHGPKNLFSMIFNYSSGVINKLFSDKDEDIELVQSYMKKYIDDVIDKGKVIKAYKDVVNESLCNEYGFEFDIIDDTDHGRLYRCFALNKRGNSTMFGSKVNNYDIVVPFQFNGTKYVYSLYTAKDNVDCEALAKKFGTIDGLGGGGHAKAAGFQTYNQIVKNNCIVYISNKLFRRDKYKISTVTYRSK
jgi:oligoribonuclease NrnB/cAMP/cGMP phosphodiesterase (DHH superfamily)